MQLNPDALGLGVTLAVIGMGGTLVILFGLSLVATILKRVFPLEVPADGLPREETTEPRA
jgi:hypothetical protein